MRLDNNGWFDNSLIAGETITTRMFHFSYKQFASTSSITLIVLVICRLS